MNDIPIARVLEGLGITNPADQQAAREVLVQAGVISSRPNRANIALNKVGQARDTLWNAFLLHCGSGGCRQKATAARSPLLVERSYCRLCGGSNDRAALNDLAEQMGAARIGRILVVGGTETKYREILETSPPGIEWRFVDGQTARHERYYRTNRNWAQVIVLWSSTPLGHKVSSHFDGKGDSRTVTVSRRGITALANGVICHLRAGQRS